MIVKVGVSRGEMVVGLGCVVAVAVSIAAGRGEGVTVAVEVRCGVAVDEGVIVG